jgi:hypothetical protein
MMTATELGKSLLSLGFLLSHHGKLLVHPSRTLWRGSGGVDLAVHVSAPRASRPPLRTVIEEAWQTFFTQHAGRAVKYGQQPECAAAGPTGRLVSSMSGYPCRGWRDNSNEQRIITDVTFCGVVLFRPGRERHFRVLIFSRYVLSRAHCFFCVESSLCLSPPLCGSNARIAFQAALPPTQFFWMNPSKPFLSWVFCTIIRRDVFALAGAILIFELWILIPRIVLWLATPYCHSIHGFWSLESLFSRPAVPQVRCNNGFLCSGHQRRYCIQLWVSVPRLSLIQG